MAIFNDVVGLVVSVLTLIGILAGALAVVIKKKKGKATKATKALETTAAVIDKGLEMIKLIPDLVAKAEEQYGAKNGASKLDYVLTKLQLYALQNNVEFKEDEVTSYVESVINTTKNVNVYKGDSK